MLLSIFSLGATEIESCGCRLATEPAARDDAFLERTDSATEPRATEGAIFERTDPATEPAVRGGVLFGRTDSATDAVVAMEVNFRMDNRINCSINALREA